MQKKTVKIARVNEDIEKTLKDAAKCASLRGKRKIFIKPNMSHPEYMPGVVTNPALLRELVGLLRDGSEEVVVGESDGFNYSSSVAFENTGLGKAVKGAGGVVLNLSEDKVVKIKFSGIGPLNQLFLPKTVLDADAVVDVALMKTHEFVVYSGAIKNLFGCVPSNRRIYLHPYLPEVFYMLYTIFKPKLTIMDARVGIEGNGPTKGNPVKMDLMLASKDALALDVAAAKVMCLDWRQTYLSYVAEKTGLHEEAIEVDGLQVNEVKHRFEPPRIDLPLKAQIEIYKHEFLTKLFFSSLDVVKLFQKVTVAYRGAPIEVV